jgi:hypothetical protein
MTTTTQTAAEFKASLPTHNSGGTQWMIETAATYINLLYPHITMVEGQEWIGNKSKYRFLCQIHGEYLASFSHIIRTKTGCQCRGCFSDLLINSAGTRCNPRASKEEKTLAAQLRAEGLSFAAIGSQLGRSNSTIQKWLNPELRKKSRQYTTQWSVDNSER